MFSTPVRTCKAAFADYFATRGCGADRPVAGAPGDGHQPALPPNRLFNGQAERFRLALLYGRGEFRPLVARAEQTSGAVERGTVHGPRRPGCTSGSREGTPTEPGSRQAS